MTTLLYKLQDLLTAGQSTTDVNYFLKDNFLSYMHLFY